jgi:hypothetical protein
MNDEKLIWEAYQGMDDENILASIDFDTLVDVARQINKRLNYKWLGRPSDKSPEGEDAFLANSDEETLKKEIEALYGNAELVKMIDEVITNVINT